MLPLALLCVALVGLLAWERHQNRAERAEWARERQLLLTRIQHPEIIVGEAQEQVVPDEVLRDLEADEMDLVGAIVNGEPDGSD